MKKMSGGQAAVESLRVENVSHVFGLIGSATMEMFDALYDADEINFIGIHDERTGTHMADGFARASGKPGVVLAGQNGPGATNLVTGLAQASAAFSPVISIAGALSSGHVYRDAFQEVDQQALFTPVTKKTWTVTQTARVPEMFREAFRVAMAPRRGPVQINLPRDILAETVDFPEFQTPDSYREHSMPTAPARMIEKAAEMLRNAKAPVIVIGGGIKNSGGQAEALALAEAYAAQPPIAVQMIKQTINQLGGALDAAILHMDADQNLLTSTTDDRKHAMQAFIDRTSPEFTGN